MKSLAVSLAALVAVFLLLSTPVVVDETEHVVVTQFGRPVAVYGTAGLRLKLPAPLQRVTRLDKRMLFTETRETELLTADKKNILIAAFVSWRISEPVQYLAALRTRGVRGGAARGARPVGARQRPRRPPLHEPRAGRGGRGGLAGLEEAVLAACREVAARDFGIEISELGVTRLGVSEPEPAERLRAHARRARADRPRLPLRGRSGRAEDPCGSRPRARRALASAEAGAARLRGEGEAEAARIYADAYGSHEGFYAFVRTLQSYEKVLGEGTTVVLPADSPFLELLLSRRPGGGAAIGR